MIYKLKVTAIGNSVGIVLPKEILERLRVQKGDMLSVTETRNGIELSRYDDETSEGMAIAERIMREDRDVLRKLAR